MARRQPEISSSFCIEPHPSSWILRFSEISENLPRFSIIESSLLREKMYLTTPKKNRKPCWFDLVGGCYTVKLSPWQWMPRIMENLSGPTRRTIGRQDFEQGLGQPRPNNKPTIRGWFIPYTWWFWGWFRVLDLPHSGVYGMGEKLGTNPPNCFSMIVWMSWSFSSIRVFSLPISTTRWPGGTVVDTY